jgi:hypothetical protein
MRPRVGLRPFDACEEGEDKATNTTTQQLRCFSNFLFVAQSYKSSDHPRATTIATSFFVSRRIAYSRGYRWPQESRNLVQNCGNWSAFAEIIFWLIVKREIQQQKPSEE